MAEKEYIEREAAIAEVTMMAEDRRIPVDSYGGEVVGEVIRLLRGIPAADVRPVVYARPVKFFNDPWTGKMFTTCSACDGKIGPKDNFCKHCGAMMEES